jgi:hypothetical protein
MIAKISRSAVAPRAASRASSKPKPCRLQWRTRVVMAERGVRSVSALRRQLATLGIDISDAQLGRIVDGRSSHFNSAIVGGLLAVLDCGLSDLIAVR